MILTGMAALLCAAPMPADSLALLKAQADSLMNREQYSQALETYIDVMERAERADSQNLYIACIGNISNIYAVSGEMERCEHYNRLGYEAALRQHDTDLAGKFIINSVGIWCSMNNVDKAREQLRLMEQHPLTDTVLWRFYTIHYAGVVARISEDFDEAIDLSTRALDYARQHRMEPKYELVQLSELGNLYLMQDDAHEALLYFRMHQSMSDSLESTELQASSCRLMAEAYDKGGHKDSAQFYMSMYYTLRDSVLDQRQLAAAKEKLYQYENRRTGRQISSLNAQLHRQWWLLALVVAVSLLALAAIWYLGRRRVAKMRAERAAKNSEGRAPIHLSDEQVEELAALIDSVMSDVATISNPDFSLQQLAARVESNQKYVSYAINQVHGKSFKTLLNECRIKEATRRLSDTEHYGNITIQGIYQDLGYNSATSFIQAFKKINGMTPSQFLKEQSVGEMQ